MDQIADMLTRIRNAQQARKTEVELPTSKFKTALAKIMESKGYIKKAEVIQREGKPYLKIILRYLDGNGAIRGLKKVSKQGQRIYVGKDDIPIVKNGYGIAVISTSQGLLVDHEARQKGLGGEVICEIW